MTGAFCMLLASGCFVLAVLSYLRATARINHRLSWGKPLPAHPFADVWTWSGVGVAMVVLAELCHYVMGI